MCLVLFVLMDALVAETPVDVDVVAVRDEDEELVGVDAVEPSEDVDDGEVVSENGTNVGTSKGGTCRLPAVSGMGVEDISC